MISNPKLPEKLNCLNTRDGCTRTSITSIRNAPEPSLLVPHPFILAYLKTPENYTAVGEGWGILQDVGESDAFCTDPLN